MPYSTQLLNALHPAPSSTAPLPAPRIAHQAVLLSQHAQNSTSSCSPFPRMQRSPAPLAPLDQFSTLENPCFSSPTSSCLTIPVFSKKAFLEPSLHTHSRSSSVQVQPDSLSKPIHPCVMHVLILSFPALRTDIRV